MDIGSKFASISADFEKNYKMPENIKVLKPVEASNSLSEDGNSEKEVNNAVTKINKFLDGEGIHLKYEKHDIFNQMIIKVIDNKTNEVLNEMPSKKILDMVAKMCEMAGILVDKKAWPLRIKIGGLLWNLN